MEKERNDLAGLRAAYNALPPENRPAWRTYLDTVGAEMLLRVEAELRALGALLSVTAFRGDDQPLDERLLFLKMRDKLLETAAYIRFQDVYNRFSLADYLCDKGVPHL